MRVEISEKKEFIKMINQINPDFKLEKINGITVDSRMVKEHDIFIPIKGLLNDGHDYIKNAINLGATILFSEKIIKQYKRPYKVIESNKKELMNLANLWINRFKPKIIAITGSNGKTTVKDLLYHIIFLSG